MPTPNALVRATPAGCNAEPGAGALAIVEDDLLRDFFAGFRPTTLRTYRRQLTQFAAWIGLPRIEALPTALLGAGSGPATQLVRRYKGALMERGASPSTVNVALSAIHSLVAMARAVGRIQWRIEVPGVKAMNYRDTAGPGVAAVRRLLEAAGANESPRLAARDQAIIRVMFDLALRCNELTTLRLADVERAADGVPIAVHILGKGRQERERLSAKGKTAAALAGWLAVRGEAPGPLFGLKNRGVAKLLDRLGARAGVGHVRPHGIRHTAITAALDAGRDVREVRKFSRHAKLDTLIRYDDNRADLAGEVSSTVAGLL